MQEERFRYLIGRIMDGVADPGERSEMSEWAASVTEGDAVPLLEEAWEHFEPRERLSEDRAAAILSLILQKRTAIIPVRRLWLRAAAAAILILAVAATAYLVLHKKQAPATAAVNPSPRPDAAAPQTTRATLILSDGTRIALDSAANGELARQGTADIKKLGNGELAYLPAAGKTGNAGNTAILYNTVSLPRGSRPMHLALSDGSIVWLNTASSIRYPVTFAGKTRKVTITGEAYFEIAHDPSRPFTVSREDDPSEIQVLGTAFNINAYPDEGPSTITLLDGSVRLVDGNHNLILKPGQQARVTSATIDLVPHPDLDETMAWKNGRFIFDRSDLATIMRQLSRWYDLDIEYRQASTETYTISVARDVPLSRLFQYIEYSGRVHFNIEGKKIIVSK